MWRHKHPRMLALALLALFASATCARDSKSDQNAADHLALALERVDAVSFYFVSRTGKYSLRPDELKSSATTKIFRKCGHNCRSYMAAIVSHLQNSTEGECPEGQQNVLIEIGKERLLYSYSGRIIAFGGKCFFNKNSVESIIKDPTFLFN